MELFELAFKDLNLAEVGVCRAVCRSWNRTCISPSFVNENNKLIPIHKRAPGTSPWMSRSKRSFLMYMKRFGRALTHLDLDCTPEGSLAWKLSRQQLRYVIKCCPNLREFRSREKTLRAYSNANLKSISKSASIRHICFQDTHFSLDDHFIHYLSRMQNLAELTLCTEYGIRPAIAAILAGCPKLQRLHVAYVASFEHIAKQDHPNLVHLGITRSDLCPQQLRQIPLLHNVKSLNLRYSLQSLEPLDFLRLVQDMPSLIEATYQGGDVWEDPHGRAREAQRILSDRKMTR